MSNSDTSSSLFRLESHPTARSRAVASSSLAEGTVVMSTPAVAAVLLESEKGRRCDSCLRERADLKRCTACQNYWYCDLTCQMIAWNANHRRLCKRLISFTSSRSYQSLSPEEKLHSLLLAQLLAEHGKSLSSVFSESFGKIFSEDLSDPISTILCLLPERDYKPYPVPTVDLEDPDVPNSLVTFISSRFANNNFTIHSARMNVFAHGVFPSASRSFNHSCFPCAVPIYRHTRGSKHITMEIRLLRSVEPSKEITISYTDPILPYSIRRPQLEGIYDFECKCFLCLHDHSPPAPATSPAQVATWESGVRRNFLPVVRKEDPPSLEIRKEFLRTWHPSYLRPLAEVFDNAKHDGQYKIAIQKGAALLAVYEAIYPSNFPMIGLLALELAKTCWNALLADETLVAHRDETLKDWKVYLTTAERVLRVLFGDFTDDRFEEEDPISELKFLKGLIHKNLEIASRKFGDGVNPTNLSQP